MANRGTTRVMIGKLSCFFQLNYFAGPIPARRRTPLVCKRPFPNQGMDRWKVESLTHAAFLFFERKDATGFIFL